MRNRIRFVGAALLAFQKVLIPYMVLPSLSPAVLVKLQGVNFRLAFIPLGRLCPHSKYWMRLKKGPLNAITRRPTTILAKILPGPLVPASHLVLIPASTTHGGYMAMVKKYLMSS
ncbi:MAG: hypothetical protein EBQ50_07065, partial [Burkholderiaceae bacterium]|nr:hypothetical protein [Burkholderiaceae bacterium]